MLESHESPDAPLALHVEVVVILFRQRLVEELWALREKLTGR
jgi:hypothetical protein